MDSGAWVLPNPLTPPDSPAGPTSSTGPSSPTGFNSPAMPDSPAGPSSPASTIADEDLPVQAQLDLATARESVAKEHRWLCLVGAPEEGHENSETFSSFFDDCMRFDAERHSPLSLIPVTTPCELERLVGEHQERLAGPGPHTFILESGRKFNVTLGCDVRFTSMYRSAECTSDGYRICGSIHPEHQMRFFCEIPQICIRRPSDFKGIDYGTISCKPAYDIGLLQVGIDGYHISHHQPGTELRNAFTDLIGKGLSTVCYAIAIPRQELHDLSIEAIKAFSSSLLPRYTVEWGTNYLYIAENPPIGDTQCVCTGLLEDC